MADNNLESDVKISTSGESSLQDHGSTTEDTEKIEENGAVLTLEASEDSFSEGSIHIVVSEPFSLTKDLELYLSENNDEEEIKRPDEDKQEILLGQFDVNQGNSNIDEVTDLGTYPANEENSDTLEVDGSIIKPCSVIITNSESKEESPDKIDKAVDAETGVYIDTPKDRADPPSLNTTDRFKLSNNDSSNSNVEFPSEVLKQIEPDEPTINIETTETSKNTLIPSGSNNGENVTIELSSEHGNKSSTSLKSLTPADMINKTLAKLVSRKSTRLQKNCIKEGGNVYGKIEESSVKICDTQILNGTQMKTNNAPNKLITEEPGQVTLNKKIEQEKISDQTKPDTSMSINDTPNAVKPSNKSHIPSVTVLSPRELINQTLARLTRKCSQNKQKITKEEEKMKSNSSDKELMVEKDKKEEQRRELINLTLEKMIIKKQPKSPEKVSNDKEENESKELPIEPVTNISETKRTPIPRESKLLARTFIQLKSDTYRRRKTKNSSLLNEPLVQEVKKEDELHKEILPNEENLETKNKSVLGKDNEKCKINIEMDEPCVKICSKFKSDSRESKLKSGKNIEVQQNTSRKYCNNSEAISLRKEMSEQDFKEEKIENNLALSESEECSITNLLDMENKKSCSPVSRVKPKLKRGRPRKFKQENLGENFPGNSPLEKVKQKQENHSFREKLRNNKQLVSTENHKYNKIQVNKQSNKSPPSMSLETTTESMSSTGTFSKEEEKLKSSSTLNTSIDHLQNIEKMPIPIVCLIDCQKFGRCAPNNSSVNKSVDLKKKCDVILKDENNTQKQTDNNFTVNSGEYFTQLELSPSKSNALSHTLPEKSETSLTKEKCNIQKDSKMNDVITIDDNDNDNSKSCPSTFTSSTPHIPQGSNLDSSDLLKKLVNNLTSKSDISIPDKDSRVSTDLKTCVQKEHLTEKVVSIDISGDNMETFISPNKRVYSTSIKQYPRNKKKKVSVSLVSTQVQKDIGLKYVVQAPLAADNQTQTSVSTTGFNLKETLKTNVMTQNIQLPKSNTQYSGNLSTLIQTPNSLIMKGNDLNSGIGIQIGCSTLIPLTYNKSLCPNPTQESSSMRTVALPVPFPMPVPFTIIPVTGPLAMPVTGPLAMPVTGPLEVPIRGPLVPVTRPLPVPITGSLAVPVTLPHNTQVKKGNNSLILTEIPTQHTTKKSNLFSNSTTSLIDPSCIYQVKNSPNIPIAKGEHYKKKEDSPSLPVCILDDPSNISNYLKGNYKINKETYDKIKGIENATALSVHSNVSSSIVSPTLNLSNTNSGSSSTNETMKERLDNVSESLTDSEISPKCKNSKSPMKRKRTLSSTIIPPNDSSHIELLTGSPSTQHANELYELITPKRRRYTTSKQRNYNCPEQIEVISPEVQTKSPGSTKKQNESVLNEMSIYTPTKTSIECNQSSLPKTIRYQETDSITDQQRTSVILSTKDCLTPNLSDETVRLSGSESTTQKKLSQNEKQERNQEESMVFMSNSQNKQSDSPKKENEEIVSKQEPHGLSYNKNVTKNQPVSMLRNQNGQSVKPNLKKEKKRIKSKEEELEECLDGAPPFIQEVFKCENIRDGFDSRDLIFVLSLLPDIEEMTNSQRVIFQLKTIDILRDVFNSAKE